MFQDRTLCPITLPNGSTIYIEVNGEGGRELVSDRKRYILSALREQIEGIGMFLNDSLQSLKPSKVTATFAIELNVSEGSLIGILAKASTKGSIELSLEWEESKPL